MAANKQDPRYFLYSPFSKRQCTVTGAVTAGAASFLTTASNFISLSANATDPVVITWANGFDPFPVDYAYKWTATASNVWGTFAAGTYYLYIDYDPSTDAVSYGSTTVAPNDDLVAPSHGAGVHWFDQTKYIMYESVASTWTERIRMFVGEAISDGGSVTTLITYALNGRYRSAETSIPGAGTQTLVSHNIGSNKLQTDIPIICKTAEFNYSIGDIVNSHTAQSGSVSDWPSNRGITTRLTIATIVGGDTTRGTSHLIVNKTTGNLASITPANWRYIFTAERNY